MIDIGEAKGKRKASNDTEATVGESPVYELLDLGLAPRDRNKKRSAQARGGDSDPLAEGSALRGRAGTALPYGVENDERGRREPEMTLRGVTRLQGSPPGSNFSSAPARPAPVVWHRAGGADGYRRPRRGRPLGRRPP